MATEEVVSGQFREDFYWDGFLPLLVSFVLLLLSVSTLVGVCLWMQLAKLPPVLFKTDSSWRVVEPVPISEPYIALPNLIQWVSDTLPRALNVDFVNYPVQVAANAKYFTPDGWKKFQQILQVYASQSSVEKNRLFVSAALNGAPYVVNQGRLQGSYGWWIQMPINLSYSSSVKGETKPLVFQVLVIRVPTLDDLTGIKINNVIVKAGEEEQGANE